MGDGHGRPHYTHWFQPLTGGTAEKHDAFVEYDGKGGVIEEFSGKLLIQQEPDASSFRAAVSAIRSKRAVIRLGMRLRRLSSSIRRSVSRRFLSPIPGSARLKVPLLRSLQAVDRAATEVCRYFDPTVSKVYSYLGWEQEYFLVDEGLYAARPDMVLTGRTLMGHESAKTSSWKTIISEPFRPG